MILAYLPAFAKSHLVFAAAKDMAGVDVANDPREALTAVIRTSDAARSSLLRRLQGCHVNQLECLPWFYGSLLFAIVAGVPQRNIDAVALTYAVSRVFFIAFYAGGVNKAIGGLRSMSWTVCIVACAYLFIHAAVVAPSPSY
jgi:uncharacterized MAPEG superfamily protein